MRQQKSGEADRLYEKYVKPLEKDHRGEYMIVSPTGQFLLGTQLYDLVETAERKFGPGNYVFKLGESAAVVWR
jgi:hypothetical protein